MDQGNGLDRIVRSIKSKGESEVDIPVWIKSEERSEADRSNQKQATVSTVSLGLSQ